MENITDEKLTQIVENLIKSGDEREHIEFKENNSNHITIGKNICAITNTMLRRDCPRGYIIWGISDDTKKLVGTIFNPFSKKVGNENKKKNEELTLWLSKNVHPTPQIEFREINVNSMRVVVLIIESPPPEICKFQKEAFIRIGSNTRPLAEYPIIEREILIKAMARDFESNTAKSTITKDEVYHFLDLEAFYRMRQRSVPISEDAVFEEGIRGFLIRDNHDSTYDITNLGALLYARDLQNFPHLVSKTVRTILYRGDSRLQTAREDCSISGYAIEFDHILQLILDKITDQEKIAENGIRYMTYLYPPVVVRELLANMLIHQDFTDNTIHPMIEIFSDRIEFTNPGSPIIPSERFIDFAPQTRNRKLADEMYKVGICESRGSGWDKVAQETVEQGYRAPVPEVMQNTTRVTLAQKCSLDKMTSEDRIWTIYIYSCWLWTHHEFLTNAHIRKIFNLPEEKMAKASILISQAVKANKIRIFDEKAGTKSRKYWPVYAKEVV